MVDLSYSFESAQRRHSVDRGHRRTPSVELTGRFHNTRNTSTSTADSRLSLGRRCSTCTPPESPTQVLELAKIDLDRVTEHAEQLQRRLTESQTAVKFDYFGPEAVDAVPSLESTSYRTNSISARRGSLGTPGTLPKASPLAGRRRSEGCVSTGALNGGSTKEKDNGCGGIEEGINGKVEERGTGALKKGIHGGFFKESGNGAISKESVFVTKDAAISCLSKRMVHSRGSSRDSVFKSTSKESFLNVSRDSSINPSLSPSHNPSLSPSLNSSHNPCLNLSHNPSVNSSHAASQESVHGCFATGSQIHEDIPYDISCKKLSLREFLGEREDVLRVPRFDAVGLRYYEQQPEDEEEAARWPFVSRVLGKVKGVLSVAVSRR